MGGLNEFGHGSGLGQCQPGRDEVNMTLRRRQTGSSIKIFVLAAALQAGVEATDLIEEFYVITVERRITHPGVAAITQAARAGLFAAWNR